MSKVVKIKTTKGELEWVTIDGEGKENLSGKLQYVANLVIEKTDPIVATIEKFWEDNKPAGFKKPAKSNGLYAHKVDSGKKDEDGKAIYEEDGKLYLAFKTGTTFPDGSVKKIQIYNAKAKKVTLPPDVKIGNGSIGAISGAMGIYENKAPKGNSIIDAGVTLYLDAIQIHKLEEYSTDAGFEPNEEDTEGWTGEEDWTGVEESDEPKINEVPKGKPRL